MNKYIKSIKILLIAAISVGFMQSCTNLDEEVYSNPTGKLILDDPANAVYLFGSAYTKLYNLYGSKFGCGMDCGTDLLVVPQRGGDWEDGGTWQRFHTLTWNDEDEYVTLVWNDCYSAISQINILIHQFESIEGFDGTEAIAELRALRAFYLWRLVDAFGNIPIVTDFPLEDNFLPEQSTRAEAYNFVVSELTEVIPLLSTETGIPMYGRMNYYAAKMLLAKLYLNAEVYTGTAQWAAAEKEIDDVLAGPFSLTGAWQDNFAADASASTENIFAIPFDMVEARTFEIHVFTLHYNIGDKWGLIGSPWNGLSAQESLYNLLAEDPNDARLEGLVYGEQYDAAGVQYEDASYEKEGSVVVDPDGPGINLTPVINEIRPNCLRQAGARIAKFPFIEGSTASTSNDYPLMRLSDLLLMKAEVIWRQNGDNDSEALAYLNQVRVRSGAAEKTTLNAQTLIDERARELFAEGHRRTDMIRFGVYTDTRWEKPDVSPDYITLWPIPGRELELNSKLKQNPGY